MRCNLCAWPQCLARWGSGSPCPQPAQTLAPNKHHEQASRHTLHYAASRGANLTPSGNCIASNTFHTRSNFRKYMITFSFHRTPLPITSLRRNTFKSTPRVQTLHAAWMRMYRGGSEFSHYCSVCCACAQRPGACLASPKTKYFFQLVQNVGIPRYASLTDCPSSSTESCCTQQLALCCSVAGGIVRSGQSQAANMFAPHLPSEKHRHRVLRLPARPSGRASL